MHSVWNFFLSKKSFTTLLMVTLTLGGLFSLTAIPKESAPEVIIPIGIVTTTLKGANAYDTEKLVTIKLEEEIKNAQGVKKVVSTSREGVSVIRAEFDASADVDSSIQNLKDAVDRAKPKLPLDATEPTVTKINFADQPFLIVSVSSDMTAPQMTDLGKTLETELKKVSGVSKVIITGTRDREIDVVLKNENLSTYGVSSSQVVQAIAQANSSLPVGNIETSSILYPLSFDANIKDSTDISSVVVTTIAGSPVYVKDVATIYDALEAPKTITRISKDRTPSESALTLSVYKKSGGDVTKISRDTNEKIEELKKTVLTGAQVVVTIDNGKQVEKDLSELTRVGLETVFLVMLVLFLTIGWREAVVASLSIPLSFVIAFIGLYASGNTINFISLFSLILAIGILVDSGIVVAEGIHTRLKLYKDVEKAARATIKEYAWPLIAGTMTTVAVFAPLFFLSGVVGQFISSIPFTIIFVLIASIFVALGMVPLLAILFAKDHKSRLEELQEMYAEKAKTYYEKLLHAVLQNKRTQKLFIRTLVVSLIISLSLPALSLVKVAFFPQDDQEYIFVSIEKERGTPLSLTDLSVREVEEILYDSSVVQSFVTTVGATSALTSESGSTAGSHLANMTILLKDKHDRDYTSSQAVTMLRKDLSVIQSAKVTVEQGNSGPSSGAPVSIAFRGENLDTLSSLAEKGETILSSISGTTGVSSSLKDNGNEFAISFDRIKASNYGISAVQVASLLRTSVSGVVATTITRNGEDIDIIVKSNINPAYTRPDETNKANLESIKNIPLSTANGVSIPLGSVIDEKLSVSRSSITRKDGKREVTVTSNVTPTGNSLDIVKEFKKREKELQTPSDVSITYGGDQEDVNKTFSEMGLALLTGMILMLSLLVIEFNSFRFSFYLLSAIPLSLIGVFTGLAISRQALSFSSMLGVIALAGVIINHAIILLDSILHNLEHELEKKEEDRATLEDIIVTSSAVRLRPIFLTTITTVIGMIPLTTVSALWGPLAYAIMFGLSFSMILTLLLIPILFYRNPGKYKILKK